MSDRLDRISISPLLLFGLLLFFLSATSLWAKQPTPRSSFFTLEAQPSDCTNADSLSTDSTASHSLTRTFYEGMKSALLFGAHQLVLIDSTLAVPADSTTYDSTLVGQVSGGVLYVSRRLYYGVLLAFRYGVTAVEPERIIKLKDFFDIPESPWGWYPIIVGSSYYRLKLGSKVYYRSPTVGSSVDGSMAGLDKWSGRFRFTLRNAGERRVRQMNLTLMRREDDDMQFFGIGGDPDDDLRSHVLKSASEEYGIFHQDLQQAQFIFGVRAGENLEFRTTWILQQRKVMRFEGGGDLPSIEEVFDVSKLPGGTGMTKDSYEEIAFRFDNTSGLEGRGISMELYGGITNGIDDGRRFLRYGIDAHVYMRMFKNHYLVPRLVTNVVRNINQDTPLAFTDYPRHPTFRPVSDRKLIRSDNMVFVPALDVHKRISNQLIGRVFVDYLLASPSVGKLQPGRGMAGVGAGLVVYTDYTDVAGIIVAYSELGPRFTFFIGAEPSRNERSRWR